MSALQVPVIGIVGGIGSGKSSVAQALTHYFRCCRLDADTAGHRALECGQVKESIRNEFGDSVFQNQGEIRRAALAALVFGDEPDRIDARRRLEAIVHPVIRETLEQQLANARLSGEFDIVLLDAALLFEAGWNTMCDGIVFLDVPRDLRLARVSLRGWTERELASREASQLDLEEKRRLADLVIDNSQELESAAASVADWIQKSFHITASPEIETRH